MSVFTVRLTPSVPPDSEEAWSRALRAMADLAPERVGDAVRLTVSAERRPTALMTALNLWKERVYPEIGSGTINVHLELIDGEPPPPGPKPATLPEPDSDGHTWLRFMPDYESSPALWYLDPNDLEGGDHGLAANLLDVLSPALTNEIEVWLADWAGWHDCDDEDARPPGEWLATGERLLEQLRTELEPRGYRIAARLA